MSLSERLSRLRRTSQGSELTLESHPDDLPKKGLFAEPIRVSALTALDPEVLEDGQHRAAFLVEVRDADGRRCTDLAVEVHLAGPERETTVQGTTDLMGRIKFRMAGPPGTYTVHVEDVAAFGLDWDTCAGPRHAEITIA